MITKEWSTNNLNDPRTGVLALKRDHKNVIEKRIISLKISSIPGHGSEKRDDQRSVYQN